VTFDWRKHAGLWSVPRDNGGQFTLRVFFDKAVAAINGPAVGVGA
jgi:hypothetical protein